MLDPNFRKSVIILPEHSAKEGCFGLVLNRPLGRVMGELLADKVLGHLASVPVLAGGPVQADQLLLAAFRWHPDSLTVANRLGSSREAESVKRRHLPRAIRPISGLWHRPIRWASAFAASRVNARARAL